MLRLALVFLTGCSFVAVKTGAPPRCSTSNAAPVLDALVAGTTLVAGLALSNNGESGNDDDDIDYYGDPDFASAAAGMLVVTGVATAIAAGYGFHETSKCRALVDSGPPLPP